MINFPVYNDEWKQEVLDVISKIHFQDSVEELFDLDNYLCMMTPWEDIQHFVDNYLSDSYDWAFMIDTYRDVWGHTRNILMDIDLPLEDKLYEWIWKNNDPDEWNALDDDEKIGLLYGDDFYMSEFIEEIFDHITIEELYKAVEVATTRGES